MTLLPYPFEQLRIGFEGVGDGADDVESGAGDVVLHALDVLVDRFLVDAEETEKTGERPMPLDDGDGDAVTFLSEGGAPVFFVDDEALGIQALEHVGDAGLGDGEVFRDVHGAGIAFRLDQMEDLFEVVVHGGGTAGAPGR